LQKVHGRFNRKERGVVSPVHVPLSASCFLPELPLSFPSITPHPDPFDNKDYTIQLQFQALHDDDEISKPRWLMVFFSSLNTLQ